LNLKRASITRVSSLIYLTPPTTMVWAFLMFGETSARSPSPESSSAERRSCWWSGEDERRRRRRHRAQRRAGGERGHSTEQ